MTDPVQRETPNSGHQHDAAAGPKTMTDLLALAASERTLVNWLVRQRGASLSAVMAHTQIEPATVEAMLDDLMAAGFLTLDEAAEPSQFKPNLISRQPRTVPDQLWNALD